MYSLKYLIDVNLPKYFQFFNHPDFIHVADMDLCMRDQDIWDYALKENLVILTKDSDFFYKSITSDHRPKVIHFQLGNMTLRDLHAYFQVNWQKIF